MNKCHDVDVISGPKKCPKQWPHTLLFWDRGHYLGSFKQGLNRGHDKRYIMNAWMMPNTPKIMAQTLSTKFGHEIGATCHVISNFGSPDMGFCMGIIHGSYWLPYIPGC